MSSAVVWYDVLLARHPGKDRIMPSVVVPSEFFKKERNSVYSDWKFAFWRELFQNSVDAGATEIKIELKRNEDGTTPVAFADNGCGMDQDVIDNVYFFLGRSSKDDGTSIGGFGRARILTCFSMTYYEIRTRDILVEGEGAQYEIKPSSSFFDGCELLIGVDASYGDLDRSLSAYLNFSNIQCSVCVNGAKWHGVGEDKKYLRHLEYRGVRFATAYSASGKASNPHVVSRVCVRVGGTAMFYQYIVPRRLIVIEVDPMCGLDALSASRDGFKDGYNYVYNEFVAELNVDTQTSLRPRYKRKRQMCKGKGMIRSARMNSELTSLSSPDNNRTSKRSALSEVHWVGSGAAKMSHQGLPADHKWERDEDYEEWLDETQQSPLCSVLHVVDTAKVGLIAAAKRYQMNGFSWSNNGGHVVWHKGREKIKLLTVWKICLWHAVEAAILAGVTSDLVWSVGWIFSEHQEAVREELSDGSFFLLRPVNNRGEDIFNIRDKKSVKRMMALAKHEVAHVASKQHNEDYASALTEIDSHFSEWDALKDVMLIKVH